MIEDTNFIDLRSDTVTRPTKAMRKAMAEAEVGDDRYGEDPTVRRLQEYFAEIVGKEDAIYVPSGTMANQVALRTWTKPGSVVVAGRNQHLVQFERAGAAKNSSIQFALVNDRTGELDPSEVESEVALQRYFGLEVSLVCFENTHMHSGGTPWSIDGLQEMRRISAGIPVHMDGARLFNAVASRGVEPSEITKYVDTVMSCVSKGLSAPVGSLLAGPSDFVDRAKVERQILGGQMRQAGIIAAAGLVALKEMRERLPEDHYHAKMLAGAVSDRYPTCGLQPENVRTNIVIFEHPDPASFISYLKSQGVLAGTISPTQVRLVTHSDVSLESIELAMKIITSAP